MGFTTPPSTRRPTMIMEDTTALGDLSVSISCSQGTNMETQDVDRIGHSGDEMLLDTQCQTSAESDDGVSLRGGVSAPRPNSTWAQKMAVTSRGDELLWGEKEDEMDFDGLLMEHAYEDDGYSTSSDWDSYGGLPLTMDEYNDAVARLEGSEDWNADQRKLHKLIYMRGLHPMMPSWWRVSFKMWGVTQPHLDDVFTPKHSNKRVVIHAYGNEVAAAKALESLFYLSQTVADYEEIGYQNRIAPAVVRGIRAYVKWAMRDAHIDRHKTPLNMLVQAYPPDFQGHAESVSADSDYAPSPADAREAGHAEMTEVTEAQRAERFTRAVSRDLERRLLGMGQRWRDLLRTNKGKGFITAPPTLYAFAVIQHIVLLASHDSSSATNPVVVLEQVWLNDRGQWLWNALSIAIPVNMARDALHGMWDTGIIVKQHDDSADDPDL